MPSTKKTSPRHRLEIVQNLMREIRNHGNCASLTEEKTSYLLEFLLPVDGTEGIRAHFSRSNGKATALNRIIEKLRSV